MRKILTSFFMLVTFLFSDCPDGIDVCLSVQFSRINYESSSPIGDFSITHNGCISNPALIEGYTANTVDNTITYTGGTLPAVEEGVIGNFLTILTPECFEFSFFNPDLSSSVLCGDNLESIIDECSICAGSGIPDGECDCNGSVLDCTGECGGNAELDECGVCEGSGASVECSDGSLVCDQLECPDEPSDGFDLTIDPTGVSQLIIFQDLISNLCNGDEIGVFDLNAILNSGDCSNQTGELLVGTDVWSGSQINLSNIGSINNCAFGGTQQPGFVDGHPAVVKVYRDGTIYETNLTFAAGNGIFGDLFIAISEMEVIGGGDCTDVVDVEGCMDETACNYDSDATLDDGSCEYAEENFDCDGNCIAELDCAGECGGSAELDACSVCDGPGAIYECGCEDIADGACDCAGNVEDACGVCDGDNSSCSGCTDVFGLNYDSSATIDTGCDYANHQVEAGMFYYAPSALQVQPGESVQWNNVDGLHDVVSISGPEEFSFDAVSGPALIGSYTFNTVGVYEYICSVGNHAAQGMTGTITVSDECASGIYDCAGVCDGNAVEDCAGECGGSAVDLGCGCGEAGPSGCDEMCGSTLEFDCNSECGGAAELDDCGVCDGSGAIYECGCQDIADGACDCAGNVDLGCGCGQAAPSGCDEQCGSTLEFDECGVCDGSGASVECLDGSLVCNQLECPDEPSDGFELTINPTGVSQLIIFQSSISSLLNGDQIGVFDSNAILNSGDCSNQTGELLVGTAVWEGEQIPLSNIGSYDNCAFGGFQAPGFVNGNPAIVKVYRDGIIYDTELTFAAGTGTFGDLFIAISEIDLGTPGCMDELACNYNPEATFNDSSCEYVIDCAGECGGTAVEDCAGECGGTAVEDCAGECGGLAAEDDCGVCEGPGAIYECGCEDIADGACDCAGNVDLGCGCGQAAPSGCDEQCGSDLEFDCNGECGGSAAEDECGVCEGPGAIYECGCEDIADGACDCAGNVVGCDGICNSGLIFDECGICDGPGAIYECGCEDIADGACDCAGNVDLGCGCGEASPSGCDEQCGSTLEFDECDVCGGENIDMDCTDTCFGTAELDECGICEGPGAIYECGCVDLADGEIMDCEGICYPGETLDLLGDGVCDDGSAAGTTEIVDGCDLPLNNLYLTSDGVVFYNSSDDIAGFQFDVDDATILGVSGGDAEENGFTVSAGGTTVLGFSFTGSIVPAGCGTLVELDLNGNASGLSTIIISDISGNALDFEYYENDSGGEGGGEAEITDGCDLPLNNLYLLDNAVLYNSSDDIAGFQFEVDGSLAGVLSGGDAEENGFTVSAGGTTVLGFSFTGSVIPAGCGTLVHLDGEINGFIDIIISDPSGNALDFEYYEDDGASSEICDDEIDNDGDGYVDCDDSDCDCNGNVEESGPNFNCEDFNYDNFDCPVANLYFGDSNGDTIIWDETFESGSKKIAVSLDCIYDIGSFTIALTGLSGVTTASLTDGNGGIMDWGGFPSFNGPYAEDIDGVTHITWNATNQNLITPNWGFLFYIEYEEAGPEGACFSPLSLMEGQTGQSYSYTLGECVDFDTLDNDEEEIIPGDFILQSPYPNPFNPTVNIPFSISRISNISINIYDVNGMKVDQIISGIYSPGTYNIKWNANGFASGTYFVTAKYEQKLHVQKVVLIK